MLKQNKFKYIILAILGFDIIYFLAREQVLLPGTIVGIILIAFVLEDKDIK